MNKEDNFSDVVTEFCLASYANYSSHSFASGYLGSMMVSMVEYLNPADRERFLRKLQRETFEQDKQANFRNKIAA